MKQFIFLSAFIRVIQFTLLIIVSDLTLCSNVANANNWQTSIYKSVLPQKIIAVDKSSQLFHYLEDEKPSNLEYTFNCTTGQVDGDKQIMNDLKTPEGVYFVQYKITNGLDFEEYGGIAYTLNYPNPVDKLRGKTGYGIWIHSKGLGIKPKDTKGCIAIGLDEIAKIGPKLSYGTAVLLAETVNIKDLPKPDLEIGSSLIKKMDKWTEAWAARSHSMFNMYDQAAYGKAMPESFNAFKANKVNLFSFLPWITIVNRQIHVLEGPGYWVTWSEQFYRAPNLSTEGIRRLYWQLNNKNEYKIVGMEWIPRNLGMRADYLKGKLVAANSSTSTDGTSSEVPKHPPLSLPEKGEQPLVKIAETKAAEIKAAEIKVAEIKAAADSGSTQEKLDKQVQALLHDKMAAWLNAWQSRSDKFFHFYNQDKFGTISEPDNKGGFKVLKRVMQEHFRLKWIEITSRPISLGIYRNYIYTESELFTRTHKQDSVQGILRLYWQKNVEGEYQIIDSSWQGKDIQMEAEHIKKVTPIVEKLILNWKKAWLNADVDNYANFYTNNAIQQNHNGKTAIINHKVKIWKAAKPKELKLSGMSIQLDSEGLIVKMTQSYKNSKGYADRGTKTLILQPKGDSYLILNEKWTQLNN